MTKCPCCSDKDYAECCEPYLSGARWPETAEALMRSRYVAYTKAQLAHLVNSAMPHQRDQLDHGGILSWASESEWQGLEIHDCEAGLENDDIGYVNFTARYKRNGKNEVHKERSRFHKIDGRWYYDDGTPAPVETFVRSSAKVGRNDPCPCGSGRKFKKCCGA